MSTHEERLHIAKEVIKGMRYCVQQVESYMGMEVKVHWNGRVKVDGEVFWEHDIDTLETKEILQKTYWKTENGLD